MKRFYQMRAWMALGGMLIMSGMVWTESKAASVSTDCTGTGGTDPCCSPGDTYVKTETALSVNPSSVTACPGTGVTVTNTYWYRRWQKFTPAGCKADEAVTPTDESRSPNADGVYDTETFTVTNGMTTHAVTRGMGNVSNTVNVAVTAKSFKAHYMKFLKNGLALNATDAVVGSWISGGTSRLQTDDDGVGFDDVSVCAQLIQSGSVDVHSDITLANIRDDNIATANAALVASGKNVYISKTIVIGGVFVAGYHYGGNIFINHAPAPSVLTHELGHVCGLGHGDAPDANHIMWSDSVPYGVPDPARRVRPSVAYKYE